MPKPSNKSKPNSKPRPKPPKSKKAKVQPSKNKSIAKKIPSMGSMKHTTTGLSECARKYATCIASPWSESALGACIPRHPARPSQKLRLYTRVRGTSGTTDTAFLVYFTPSLASDAPSVWISQNSVSPSNVTNTVFNSTFPVNLTSTTGDTNGNVMFQGYSVNSPYSCSSLIGNSLSEPTVRGRIVSTSLRVQYTGTVLNMGGVRYPFSDPNHGNTNGLAPSSLGTQAETAVERLSEKSFEISLCGIDDGELSYPSNDEVQYGTNFGTQNVYPLSNGELLSSTFVTTNSTSTTGAGGHPTIYNVLPGGAPGVICVIPAASSTFEVEVITHVEFIGIGAAASLTPTHSDSVGFETVNGAAAMLPSMQVARPNVSPSKLMSEAIEMVRNGLSYAAGTAHKMDQISGGALTNAALSRLRIL
jgi:hypothetical protein